MKDEGKEDNKVMLCFNKEPLIETTKFSKEQCVQLTKVREMKELSEGRITCELD
jgi:hypothetical protein